MDELGEFEVYVACRRRSLLRTAWLLTGDWHAAEDLVQTALMRCYPKWGRLHAQSEADAYVRRAIFNTYVSLRRRKWRGELACAVVPESSDGDISDEVVQSQMMLAALARLAPRQRAVIVLRFYEDLTEADTALSLGCTVGTVKSQTAKALRSLRNSGVVPATNQSEVSND